MKLIYADYNSTYPCSPEHVMAVARRLQEADGNPSNIHQVGRRAKLALEEARSQIVVLLGGKREELTFTSGATEANNWLVFSLLEAQRRQRSCPPQVVMSAGEHPSIAQPLRHLHRAGLCELITVPLEANGRVDEAQLLAAVGSDTALVCLIYAHNEVGAINPLAALAPRLKARSPHLHLHVDAVQAFGKLPMQWLGSSQVDSVALSAHKVGGFKGIGALWLKDGGRLAPMILGGGQERGVRSGTENLAGALSFGLRAQEISARPAWLEHLRELGRFFAAGLMELPGACLHSDPGSGLPGTINFHVEGLAAEVALLQLDMAGICVSSGSACSSGQATASEVLLAMGYGDWVARNSLRVSFGAGSTAEDAGKILSVLRQCRS